MKTVKQKTESYFSFARFPLLIIPVFFLSSLVLAQEVGDEGTKSKKKDDTIGFLPLVIDSTLDITFILDELNILDYQQKKLVEITTEAKRDWIQLLISKHELTLSDDVRSYEEIRKTFTAGFEEVLLPAQIEGFGRVLRQRRILKESQIEAFVLPALDSKELGLDSNEQAKLREGSKRRSDEFKKRKAELLSKAWSKIGVAMPEQEVNELRQLLAIIEKAPFPDSDILFSELSVFDKSDFEKYESREFARWVLSLRNFEPAGEWFGISEFQKTQMTEICNDRIASLSQKRQHVDPTFARLIFLAPEGKLKELKAEIRKAQNAEYDLQQSIAEEMSRIVLTKEQTKSIELMSKFRRFALESCYGDEFAYASAWNKSFGNIGNVEKSNNDDAKFLRTVDSARNKYYEKIDQLRLQAGKETLGELPAQAKAAFTTKYGELYDYHSEQRQRWDKLRSEQR